MASYIESKSKVLRRRTTGMALVEIIVAISLLTLVIVSLTQAFI